MQPSNVVLLVLVLCTGAKLDKLHLLSRPPGFYGKPIN
jgi:hypothetical protein